MIRLRAPAKLNLCLYVGPTREDGLHEIASIFEPLELADELQVSEASGDADEVICAEVGGPNLVEKALAAMRERGWRSPPLRVEIQKRIPVAAGLGGGSADAAAVLRLARGELDGIRAVAASVGADVPSQLQPRPCVVAGAGEVVEPIPPPGDHGVVLVPQTMGLTTGDVYAEADRLGLTRGEAELESIRRKLRDAVIEAPRRWNIPSTWSTTCSRRRPRCAPRSARRWRRCWRRGAPHAMVTGSGPTAFGLFADRHAADRAAAALAERFPTRGRDIARWPRERGRAKPGVARMSRRWIFRLVVAALVVAFFVFRDELPEFNLEEIIKDLSEGLGAWTYLLVALLAFLETGAFVGLVAPGEFTVLLGGAVAGQGDISLPLILAITWLSAFLGDTVSFMLGDRLGRDFLVRHGPRFQITEERLKQVEDYFARHGGKTILIGRFIGLVRALAPFIAGTSNMGYRAFWPYSVLGTGLWAATFILIGYFASQSLDTVAEIVSRGLI